MKDARKILKQKKLKTVNKRGDIRDAFKHNEEIPFLAPADFKPLEIH